MSHTNTMDSLAKTAKHAGAIAADTFHDAEDGVRHISHAIESESSKLIHITRVAIRERPTLAIGIAAGVGILIGLAMAGRHRG